MRKPVRRFGAHKNSGVGLEGPHLVEDLEDKIGKLVHPVASVLLEPAQIEFREIVVGEALLGGDPHFGHGRLVIELEPKSLEEFFRLLAGEATLLKVAPVERPKVLIDPPGAEGVPGVRLVSYAHVDEPVVLEGLPEGAGRMGRDPVTDLRHLPKLLFAGRISFFLRHLLQLFRVAAGIDEEGVGGDIHGPKLTKLFVVFRVRGVEVFHRSGDLLFYLEEAHFEKAVAAGGVAWGPLLHEFRPDPGLIGFDPFFGKVLENEVPHGFSPPKRDDLLLIKAFRSLVHTVGHVLPGVEDLEISEAMNTALRVGGDFLWAGAAQAHDELPLFHREAHPLEEVFQGQSPLDGHRQARRSPGFIELGEKPGPLA